jgi:hypothetical protein
VCTRSLITGLSYRSETDSIYGARHLADKMSRTQLPTGVSELKAIDLFVLLDLLGAKQPQITSSFDNTRDKFETLASIERRLARANLLHAHTTPYFRLERVSETMMIAPFFCVSFLASLITLVSNPCRPGMARLRMITYRFYGAVCQFCMLSRVRFRKYGTLGAIIKTQLMRLPCTTWR